MTRFVKPLIAVCVLLGQVAYAGSGEKGGFTPIQSLEGSSSMVLNYQSGNTNAKQQLGFYGQTLLSNQDNGVVLGYRSNNSAFSVLSGQGEGSEFSGAAKLGVEQSYFHGGSFQAFSYQGVDWAYQFDKQSQSQFQLGHVQIDALALEQRTADYLQFSNDGWSLGYTQVKRGGVNAGNSLDLSFNVGDALVSAQRLNTKAGGEFHALSLAWIGKLNDRFAISLSTKHNELLEEASSSRVMFSYQRQLGLVFNQDEEATKEKKDRLNTGVLIGAGAVAVALISSSGSDSQDNSPRFAQQHQAAKGVLNGINPTSVQQNREYGGYVYRTSDGRYIATKPIKGDVDSIALPFSLIPAGGTAAASYHTHAGPDPRYDNENFSFVDIQSDQTFGLDGYLGTPGGQFLWHDQRSNRVVKLGTIAN